MKEELRKLITIFRETNSLKNQIAALNIERRKIELELNKCKLDEKTIISYADKYYLIEWDTEEGKVSNISLVDLIIEEQND